MDDKPEVHLVEVRDVEAVKNFIIDIWNMKNTVNPEKVLDFIERIYKSKIKNDHVLEVMAFLDRVRSELLLEKVAQIEKFVNLEVADTKAYDAEMKRRQEEELERVRQM